MSPRMHKTLDVDGMVGIVVAFDGAISDQHRN